MDIRIKGDMDGAETARILRERFDVPVVYLTAHADRDTLERAKQSRPLGYIVKPFHEAELHASVEMALYKHWHDRRSRSREQHVTDVLGALILGITSVDQAETIRMMNRAAEDLTGWSTEEATGTPVRQVFRLADAATGRDLELPLEQALEQRSVVEIRDRVLITKNGGQKPVSGNIAPLRGADGGPGGAVIMFEAGAGGTRRSSLCASKTRRREDPRHRIRALPYRGGIGADETAALLHAARRQKRGLDGVDRGRKRNRQGSDGAVPALFEQPPHGTVRRAQLFGHPRGAARKRIIRTRAGSLHRCPQPEEGLARSSPRRNLVPG